ncbi:MAG: hypothetical protein SGPRY_010901 [Prymnesium sp.]
MQAALATALAAAAGCGLYFAYRRARQCKLRLTYFDVRAAPGEKLRLALALAGVPFEDHRIASKEWEELKPTTKYGQLPILEIDGVSYYQSGALLRWIGSTLGDGSLYPSSAAARMKVEEMMGLADDIAKAWAPALYIGMKPQAFQYTKENAPVREMREHFMAEEFPKYMGMVENELKQTGAFICGVRRSPEPDTPSRLLYCVLYPQLFYFGRGVADYVPKDCFEPYPLIRGWIARMRDEPSIKAFEERSKY